MRGDPRYEGMSPRVLYRLAVIRGLTPQEAADLVAWMHGLEPHHWTIKQVVEIIELREERRRQLIG
jgi:hypothetical protein